MSFEKEEQRPDRTIGKENDQLRINIIGQSERGGGTDADREKGGFRKYIYRRGQR